MSKVDPELLLRMIQEGDEAAFLEMYSRWQGIIYRYAWQMTGSTNMAEDITQDVFLLMIRKKLHFDPSRGNFSSFIYGVARNISLKAVRKNQRFFGILQVFENQRAHHNLEDPFFQLTKRESTTRLRQCVLSLPPRYREVVILCDLHDLSYAEAAAVTNSAPGTIRSRLHRARELLMQKARAFQEAESKNNKGGTRYEIPAL